MSVAKIEQCDRVKRIKQTYQGHKIYFPFNEGENQKGVVGHQNPCYYMSN